MVYERIFMIGSARQNSNIHRPRSIGYAKWRLVRSAAARALRDGRIKMQHRAATARQKQKVSCTVQARRGVCIKTARHADPARQHPKHYFTVLVYERPARRGGP
jgi:hypothetical protein